MKACVDREMPKPRLLSGDNPQIAKADGDAPVQASIAAIPGSKQDVARRLDALVVRTVLGVRKAVKWRAVCRDGVRCEPPVEVTFAGRRTLRPSCARGHLCAPQPATTMAFLPTDLPESPCPTSPPSAIPAPIRS